ncbi:MAG: dihydrofolate reductase family protein [Caldilineaceae bacterium]|nr:dihydrofolate reductase family protein [Caldilineaceae bacterium]
MILPTGLDRPFQLLYSEPVAVPSLPAAYRALYPGDWPMQAHADRPYIYTNFAPSRDGRISFNEPNATDASHVTKADPHDRWLMGLLRVRAHAILVGDNTVRLEPGHIWTPEFICPPEAAAFADLRQAEGYSPVPKLVILSFDGNLDFSEERFQNPDLHIILATTARGAAHAAAVDLAGQCAAGVDVLTLGGDSVDLHRLVRVLYSDYAIHNLLCEGGARVFANFLDAGLVDEEFITLCPTFVGRSPERFRPSYTEGVAWTPDNAPYSQPVSIHKSGDYLFLRTRCRYPALTRAEATQ